VIIDQFNDTRVTDFARKSHDHRRTHDFSTERVHGGGSGTFMWSRGFGPKTAANVKFVYNF